MPAIWTNPKTWAVEVPTPTDFNEQIRNNQLFLDSVIANTDLNNFAVAGYNGNIGTSIIIPIDTRTILPFNYIEKASDFSTDLITSLIDVKNNMFSLASGLWELLLFIPTGGRVVVEAYTKNKSIELAHSGGNRDFIIMHRLFTVNTSVTDFAFYVYSTNYRARDENVYSGTSTIGIPLAAKINQSKEYYHRVYFRRL